MTKTDRIIWVKNEFLPIPLATDDVTIQQIDDNAIRFWNVHSAFPIVKMFSANSGTKVVTLDPEYKNVVQIFPDNVPDWVLQNYPLWSLLGITIIDNLTSDLIMLSEAYRNYRYYIGTEFKYTYVKSDDPTVAGSLYLYNLPGTTSSIAVVGTKRILKEEDIKSEYILSWLLPYIKALVKLVEGNVLRKASSIEIANDGQRIYDEGREEKEKLEERLSAEGRWLSFIKRF